MGVDFISYSNVIVKPIPIKYRAKKIKNFSDNLLEKINNLPNNMKSLYMVMNGISINNDMEIYIQDKLEISKESEEWLENVEKDNKFIQIDWYNNKIYYESEDSIKESTGRSYSGYSDFINYCQKIINFRYILPSTDSAPENGILDDKNKIKILIEDLNKLKSIFEKENDDYHKWFYDEFYKMVVNALDNGIIIIF